MLGWFVETTLVASGLAVVAALASRLRSIGPTARHLLWLVVLVRLVTPPLVCWPWAVHWGGQSWPSSLSPLHSRTRRCADDSLAGAADAGLRGDHAPGPRPHGRASSRRTTDFRIAPAP